MHKLKPTQTRVFVLLSTLVFPFQLYVQYILAGAKLTALSTVPNAAFLAHFFDAISVGGFFTGVLSDYCM